MPTARGWVVAAAAVTCYLEGWLLGYPELVVLSVGGALAIAVGWLRLARPVRLHARREIAPGQVPRGDPALAVLSCSRARRWPLGPVRAGDRCGADHVDIDLPTLYSGGSHTTCYRLPTARRGHIPVGPLRLTATDPLGLIRRVYHYGNALTL